MILLESDSHDVIADAVVNTLEKPLFYDGHDFFRYRNGVWSLVDAPFVVCQITNILGQCMVPSHKGQAKKLRMSKSLVDSVTFFCRDKLLQKKPVSANGALFSNVRVSENLRNESPNPDFFDRIAFEYALPTGTEPDCPQFTNFLMELLQSDQMSECKALLEFIGACLIGIAYRYQMTFTLFGKGANGKSELLNIFAGLFPNELVGSLSVAEWSGFSLCTLSGKRINIVSELPDRNEMLTETFKAVTTGDNVKIEQKYRPVEYQRITCGHIFSTNSLAGFINVDDATMRRIAIIELRNSFSRSGKRDIAKSILEAEKGHIALLCLQSAARLIARGYYDLPSSGYTKLIAVNDICYEFAEKNIDKIPRNIHQMYLNYSEFVRARGFRPLNQRNFENRLLQYEFKIKNEEVYT